MSTKLICPNISDLYMLLYFINKFNQLSPHFKVQAAHDSVIRQCWYSTVVELQ